MRRGTAAILVGAMATAALGVTVRARLAGEWRGELTRPELAARASAGRAAAACEASATCEALPLSAERVEQASAATTKPSTWCAESRDDSAATSFTHRVRVVRAADGRLVAGADVTLRDDQGMTIPPDGCRPAIELRTDERGELLLQLDRSVDAIVRVPGFCAEAEEIRVGRDAPADVTIALFPSATLSGRVVDAAGAPVAGAEVLAHGHFAREVGFVAHGGCGNGWAAWNRDLGTTDAEGRFGPVACYSGRTTAFEVRSGERCVWLAGVALDAARGPAFDVELRLPPKVELVVRAVRPDGRPAHGDALDVDVTRCFDLFDELECGSPLDEDGCVTMLFDAPGLHRIEIGPRGCDDSTGPAGWQTFDRQLSVGTTELEVVVPWPDGWVDGGDLDEADAGDGSDEEGASDDGDSWPGADEPAPEPGSISGTVACDCAIDELCDSLRVVLRRDGVEIDSCRGFDEGAFEFDVAPGVYVVALEGAGHRRVETAVVLEPGGSSVLPRLVAPAIGHRCGRLIDPCGVPLDGILVTLVGARDPDHEQCDDTTDEAGRFRIARIDGPCFLDVVDYEVGNFRFAVPDDLPDDWVVTLPAPRRITGAVVVPLGVPLEWIELLWWERPDPARHAELLRVSGGAASGRLTLDDDGRFTIERAPSADCVLQLRLANFPDVGCTIARRLLPAGGDVDLGIWEIPAAR